jgi:hypothetical protein
LSFVSVTVQQELREGAKSEEEGNPTGKTAEQCIELTVPGNVG